MPHATTRFDLERVSREAAGHPMFLHEIIRHLQLAGTGAAAASLCVLQKSVGDSGVTEEASTPVWKQGASVSVFVSTPLPLSMSDQPIQPRWIFWL